MLRMRKCLNEQRSFDSYIPESLARIERRVSQCSTYMIHDTSPRGRLHHPNPKPPTSFGVIEFHRCTMHDSTARIFRYHPIPDARTSTRKLIRCVSYRAERVHNDFCFLCLKIKAERESTQSTVSVEVAVKGRLSVESCWTTLAD